MERIVENHGADYIETGSVKMSLYIRAMRGLFQPFSAKPDSGTEKRNCEKHEICVNRSQLSENCRERVKYTYDVIF
jgi:hypothetical protein